MKSNKFLNLFAFFGFILGVNIAFAEEPVCKKCQIIREYNKQHPGKSEYYEDYLKENSFVCPLPQEAAKDQPSKEESINEK